MKHKFLKVALFAAIVMAIGWNISQSEKGVKLSDIALENVEALTGGETGGDGKPLCRCGKICPDGTEISCTGYSYCYCYSGFKIVTCDGITTYCYC